MQDSTADEESEEAELRELGRKIRAEALAHDSAAHLQSSDVDRLHDAFYVGNAPRSSAAQQDWNAIKDDGILPLYLAR